MSHSEKLMNCQESQASGPATAATAPERLPLGILLTVFAFFFVAIMSAFAKVASNSVPSTILVFFQSFISLLLLLPWILYDGIRSLKTGHVGLHAVRGVAGLLSQLFFFIALKFIPLVDAVLLVNAAPLFIPFVVLIWLKSRVRRTVWISVGIGFVGILLILQPGAGVFSWATLLGIVAGICSAVALVAVSRLHATETALRVLFYYFLISSVLTAPLLRTPWASSDPQVWLWVLGIGVCMAVSQLLLILAYAQASPARMSPFNYSVVVFSGLIDWYFWHQTPNLLAAVGIVLVCVGGIVATLQHHKRQEYPPHVRSRVPASEALCGGGSL
jgi:drug/metabolite transporter (DMT)-like permease